MSKPTTYVLLATDVSGSMYALADDVRGGYNAYLDDLGKDVDVASGELRDPREAVGIRYRVTSVLFNTGVTLLCTSAKPKDAPRLDTGNYTPNGGTALLDAIGKVITDFEAAVLQLGADDRVLLVAQTDGQENSSREYTREGIAKMIKDREDAGKWAAIFMGAGPDTWQQAGSMGFSSSIAVAATGQGVSSSYEGLSRTSAAYAKGATRGAAVAESGLDVKSE